MDRGDYVDAIISFVGDVALLGATRLAKAAKAAKALNAAEAAKELNRLGKINVAIQATEGTIAVARVGQAGYAALQGEDGRPAAYVGEAVLRILGVAYARRQARHLECVRAANPSKGPLWTSTSTKSGVENALGHFKKHGAEFPEYANATQYARGARDFVTNPPAGTLSKVRANGDKLFYNPTTNTFAVQRGDGALRTMFRPTEGINYWNKQ